MSCATKGNTSPCKRVRNAYIVSKQKSCLLCGPEEDRRRENKYLCSIYCLHTAILLTSDLDLVVSKVIAAVWVGRGIERRNEAYLLAILHWMYVAMNARGL